METLMEIQNINENADKFTELYIGGLRDLYLDAEPVNFLAQQEEYKAFASTIINSELSDEVKLGFFEHYNNSVNERKEDLKTLFKNIDVVRTTLEIKEQFLSEYLKADNNEKLDFEEFINGLLTLKLDEGVVGSGYLTAYIANNPHVEGLMHHEMVWKVQELSRKNLLKEIRLQLEKKKSTAYAGEFTKTDMLVLQSVEGLINAFIGDLWRSILNQSNFKADHIPGLEKDIIKVKKSKMTIEELYGELRMKSWLKADVTIVDFRSKMRLLDNINIA